MEMPIPCASAEAIALTVRMIVRGMRAQNALTLIPGISSAAWHSCRGLLHGLFHASAVDDVDYVAQILFVGDSVGGVGGEFGFGFEVRREFAEELDAIHRVELIATQKSLNGQCGFGGGHPLPEASDQVSVFTE